MKIKVTVLVLNLFITCHSKLITITTYNLTWIYRLDSPSRDYNWIVILSKDYRVLKHRGYTIQFSSFYRATDIWIFSWHLKVSSKLSTGFHWPKSNMGIETSFIHLIFVLLKPALLVLYPFLTLQFAAMCPVSRHHLRMELSG